jgi:hypothetical protein
MKYLFSTFNWLWQVIRHFNGRILSIIPLIMIGAMLSVCELFAFESIAPIDQTGDFPKLGFSSLSESSRMPPKHGQDPSTASIENTPVKQSHKTIPELMLEQNKIFQDTSLAIRALIAETQHSSIPEEALVILAARLTDFERNIHLSEGEINFAIDNLGKLETELTGIKKMSSEGYILALSLFEKNKANLSDISKKQKKLANELTAFGTLVHAWQVDYSQLMQIDSDAANADLAEKLVNYLKTIPFLF